MHTHEAGSFRFHYNGDFSGDVVCIDKKTEEKTVIPAEDIRDLVAVAYVMPRKARALEEATSEQLLLGNEPDG